jgi:hypothetical protein
MNKLVMAFLFCFVSTIANAQEIFDLVKPLKCSKPENVMNHFREDYQEMPLWVGKTTTGTHVTLLVNKETKSWTLIEYDAVVGCVLGAGDLSSKPEVF